MGIGPFMGSIYLSFFLFVLTEFWKVLKVVRTKFSCVALMVMALYSFWLDSCFSEMGNIT